MNTTQHSSGLHIKAALASFILGAGLLLAVAASSAAEDIPPATIPATPAAAADDSKALPGDDSTAPIKLPEFVVNGDLFLGLKNGSLIESIYFRNVWLKLHPAEDVIVLVTSADGKDGRYPPITAVAVYSQNGKVLAHSPDYGPVLLSALMPDDLKRNAAHCLDEYRKTIATLPRKPVPAVGTIDEQVQRAFNATHDPKTMPYFPVALADFPGKIKKPDGTLHDAAFKCLVFDWNDAHYIWRPSMGAHREDPPKDPLTGRPYLCVQHSDLVEALIFINDYKKAHPKEKAVLLYAPTKIDLGVPTAGYPAAAYTVNGVVYIRGYFSAPIPANSKEHPCSPADLDNPKALADLFQNYKNFLILSVFDKHFTEEHPFDSPDERDAAAYYETLPSVFPQSLPGDTAEMQENRVFQRATEAGVPCWIGNYTIAGRLVGLRWQTQRFCYAGCSERTGKAASFYDQAWDPNDMNRLIDAILFAHDFKPENPGDTVAVLPYHAVGQWEIVNSAAIFVRDGKVWAHNPVYGDTPMPDANPADLADPKKHHALRRAADQAIHAIAGDKVDEMIAALTKKLNEELFGNDLQHDDADTRNQIYRLLMRQVDMSNVEVPSIYEKLKAAGIDCALSATTTERGPDGKITEYELPSLSFTFQGVRYTYGPEHYCSTADNLVLDP
jgi:hypothetical protein